MIAANNTETLRQLNENEISFESLVGLKHGETVSTANSKVVMVINSAVDSKFYIESFNYTSIYGGNVDNNIRETQASKMNVVIRESGGATFINFMRKISDDILETSYNSICFVIRTFFVGHKPDGTTETIPIKPISLILGSMNSSFDHTGGVHTLDMFGASNGAPLNNHSILYVNRNLNLVTNDNSILLKDMITDLEKKLNKQLEEQFAVVKTDAGGNGRKVKYKITIPEDWSHYTIKCTTKDNYIEKLFDKEKQAVKAEEDAQKAKAPTAKKGPENDRFKSHVNTAVKTTVIQVLNEIFKHCDQIHEALIGNAKLKPEEQHEAKLHKVLSSITSDPDLITIHFDVINYYLPRIHSKAQNDVIQNKTKALSDDARYEAEKAKRHAAEEAHGITFEYIFTGMNSDIISFDIKAEHTNTIFNATRPGVTKAVREAINPPSNDPKEVKDNNKKSTAILPMRKYDAVFLPELSAEGQQGYIYASPDSTALRDNYVKALARLNAVTTSNAHLVIRGNPIFLNQTVREIFPHNDGDYDAKMKQINDDALAAAKKQKKEFDPLQATTYMAQYTHNLPQFARVVIKTPVINEESKETKYEEFWYDGYYWITQIENRFANGEFTQELYIKPYDLDDLTPA